MFPQEGFKDRLDQELVGQQPPPLGPLTADALTAGRRIHRRERAFGVLGSVAAVAAVAVGATALAGGFGSASATPVGGLSPTGVGPTTAVTGGTRLPPALPVGGCTITPSGPLACITPRGGYYTAPSGSRGGPIAPVTIPTSWRLASPYRPSDAVPADGQAVLEILKQRLAEIETGSASDYSGQTFGANGGVDASLTWTTARGPVAIDVAVWPVGETGPLCGPDTSDEQCAARTLSDGTQVALSRYTNPHYAKINDEVMILRTDGVRTQVAVAYDRTAPRPLTDDQLFAIASDPRWGLTMERGFVSQADKVITPFHAIP